MLPSQRPQFTLLAETLVLIPVVTAMDGDALHITDAAADLDATECCALSWLLLKQSMMLQPGAAYFCCFECCRVLDSVLAKYDAATEGRVR